MSPFRGFAPDRPDLCQQANASYTGVLAAVARYREATGGVVQNPGLPLDDAALAGLYEEYLLRRDEIVRALHADIVVADQLFAEILEAIQATDGQPPPPGGPAAGGKIFLGNVAAAKDDARPPGEGKRRREEKQGGFMPVQLAKALSGGDDLDWEASLELADETLDMLDELPDEADDFATSVREKCENMKRWIESRGRVTAKMVVAIENMHRGARRWLES